MSPMTIAAEAARNNGLKFCTMRDLFAYGKVDLLIFLIFLSTKAPWNILSFHSYFVLLKILCPYLGASNFGHPPAFRK